MKLKIIFGMVFVVLFIVGCSNTKISKEEAENIAKDYLEPQVNEIMEMLGGGIIKPTGDEIYVLESSDENGGYCIEFAFSYRKEIGLPAKELDYGRPSTIPIFVNNKGKVKENDARCIYKSYPELEI